MISCVIGLPGSGKSTLLAYIAHRAALGKRVNFHGLHIQTTQYERVYTNFPAKGCYKLDFEQLGKSDYHHCLILCDEIQLFADSRNFRDFSDDLKFWFSNHRKLHTDFCFATQSFDAVDKRIRSLTDRIYYVDQYIFNLIRCREILTTFDFRTLNQMFEPARCLRAAYFYAPRLYKFNDTYALMKERIFKPVELVPWDDTLKPYKINLTKNNVENCTE